MSTPFVLREYPLFFKVKIYYATDKLKTTKRQLERYIYLMQKRATCVGRRSKCLRFQPSKSSSSSPLEAYYRTFTERGKNLKRMNLFHSSRAAASRRSFLFFGPSSSFFRCWSVHPYQKKQSTTTQKAENDISNQQKERIRSRSFSRWAPVSENA